jgi:hypothetical protein
MPCNQRGGSTVYAKLIEIGIKNLESGPLGNCNPYGWDPFHCADGDCPRLDCYTGYYPGGKCYIGMNP